MPIRNDNRQQTVGWTPAVFQGEEWSPTPFDYSIMERSLARQEERKQKAAEKENAVDLALADVETKLHKDPTTDKWWADYKTNIKQQIQDYANVGDYAGALNTATSMPGKILNDTAVLGRIKFNADLKEAQKKIDEDKTLDQAAKDYWSDLYGENAVNNGDLVYEDTFDDNGNIIGGTTFSAPTLLPRYDNVKAVAVATQFLAEKTYTSNITDSRYKTYQANLQANLNKAGQEGHTYRRKLAEDIRANVNEIIKNMGIDAIAQIKQEYDIYLHTIQKEEERLLQLSEGTKEHNDQQAHILALKKQYGDPQNYQSYFSNRLISDILIENAAYNNREDTYKYFDVDNPNETTRGNHGKYVQNQDGTWSVIGPNSQVGSMKFNTLAEAILASGAGKGSKPGE